MSVFRIPLSVQYFDFHQDEWIYVDLHLQETSIVAVRWVYVRVSRESPPQRKYS